MSLHGDAAGRLEETAKMTDTEAMVKIHHILDGRVWSSDHLEYIAEIVDQTGRTIRSPENEIDSAKLWDEDGICLTCGDLRARCTGDNGPDDEEDDDDDEDEG